MTSDDLRERVARALKDHPLVPFTDDAALTLAYAVIALVLEEAARCAEDCSVALNGTYEAIHIAAAIRALKEQAA